MTTATLPAASRLIGRSAELEVLFGLVDRASQGGEALVLRGEPGIGKTSLLQAAGRRAADAGLQVLSTAGVQSEADLAFAGLHQLVLPVLAQVRPPRSSRLEYLPGPQRDALTAAFGLSGEAVPSRFLVGVAVLGLLSTVAEGRPLVCLVDDAQWLDRASGQALAFMARRLAAESVVVLFASREPSDELRGLPELVVDGLADRHARELLNSVVQAPFDERVREQIVAETRGNPSALLELRRGRSPAQLAGGFGLPDVRSRPGRIEEDLMRRLEGLPNQTRLLLVVAAAEPIGDPALLWHAAARLGIARGALEPAESAGLIEISARVRFRDPLVRSAAYRSASVHARRSVHVVLAELTDTEADPDRRAWHRAQATTGPDEDVAGELERSVGRAQARGGLAAAAAFVNRAVALTPDPVRKAQRALAAVEIDLQAGAFEVARGLLAAADAGPLDDLGRARVELLRARLAFASGHAGDAPPLLLKAASWLERLDFEATRETHLDAFHAALTTGRFSSCGMRGLAEAARAALPATNRRSAPDLLLDGVATLITEGYTAGSPVLKRALSALRGQELSSEEGFRWLPLGCRIAHEVWDDESWYALSTRLIELARDRGALAVLLAGLHSSLAMRLFQGELAAAASIADEAGLVSEAIGNRFGSYGTLVVAAWRGDEAMTLQLAETAARELAARREDQWVTGTRWATAVLYNGLGRYEEALDVAERGSGVPHELGYSNGLMIELIEAAARRGAPERAAAVLPRLSEAAHASGTDWALGVEARARALLSEAKVAEPLYREAIDRLARTRAHADLARARLLYGEWLRRERRRLDGREQLRAAREMFLRMDAGAFALRAERELLATGERARKRTAQTREDLTAQETQIAGLARDGLSNLEIGARLFISPRTVEWHLHKVFSKLDINSRNQLGRALPGEPRAALAV